MKQNPLLLIIVLITIFAIQSCNPKENNQNQDTIQKVEPEITQVQPGFVHAVYFWLKKDNPELLAEFIDEGLPKLAKVSSIQSVSWGPPGGQPRDVVDNSYDLAWIVHFENAEEEQKYQVDPLHVEFVEKYKALFEKVVVYDNLVDHYVSN